jgi:hypothetical protein
LARLFPTAALAIPELSRQGLKYFCHPARHLKTMTVDHIYGEHPLTACQEGSSM